MQAVLRGANSPKVTEVSAFRKTTFFAAATGLAAAGVRQARNRLRFETDEDELVRAHTDDGWSIAMYRYRPHVVGRHHLPIVASHGFAGSHLSYDLGPSRSLARYLAEEGFDVYAIDLRGRGQSWPDSGPSRGLQWSFDDFVFHDLPAVLRRACEISGSSHAFWIGLEMSGLALYAAAISGTASQVHAGITLGSPALTPRYAKVPGITATPRQHILGRVPFRAGARIGGPLLAAIRSKELESSFRPSNCDRIVPARYLLYGVPDESAVLADQFTDWMDNQTMRDLSGSVVWSDRLNEVRLPVLVATGAADLQRPAAATRATYEALGSQDKTFLLAGTEEGFSVDYGHDDLISGRSSPYEVWPRLLSWLVERDFAASEAR